jgi:hypothetical protein
MKVLMWENSLPIKLLQQFVRNGLCRFWVSAAAKADSCQPTAIS